MFAREAWGAVTVEGVGDFFLLVNAGTLKCRANPERLAGKCSALIGEGAINVELPLADEDSSFSS